MSVTSVGAPRRRRPHRRTPAQTSARARARTNRTRGRTRMAQLTLRRDEGKLSSRDIGASGHAAAALGSRSQGFVPSLRWATTCCTAALACSQSWRSSSWRPAPSRPPLEAAGAGTPRCRCRAPRWPVRSSGARSPSRGLPGGRIELGSRRSLRPCPRPLDASPRPSARRQPRDGRGRRRSSVCRRRLCGRQASAPSWPRTAGAGAGSRRFPRRARPPAPHSPAGSSTSSAVSALSDASPRSLSSTTPRPGAGRGSPARLLESISASSRSAAASTRRRKDGRLRHEPRRVRGLPTRRATLAAAAGCSDAARRYGARGGRRPARLGGRRGGGRDDRFGVRLRRAGAAGRAWPIWRRRATASPSSASAGASSPSAAAPSPGLSVSSANESLSVG